MNHPQAILRPLTSQDGRQLACLSPRGMSPTLHRFLDGPLMGEAEEAIPRQQSLYLSPVADDGANDECVIYMHHSETDEGVWVWEEFVPHERRSS